MTRRVVRPTVTHLVHALDGPPPRGAVVVAAKYCDTHNVGSMRVDMVADSCSASARAWMPTYPFREGGTVEPHRTREVVTCVNQVSECFPNNGPQV